MLKVVEISHEIIMKSPVRTVHLKKFEFFNFTNFSPSMNFLTQFHSITQLMIVDKISLICLTYAMRIIVEKDFYHKHKMDLRILTDWCSGSALHCGSSS